MTHESQHGVPDTEFQRGFSAGWDEAMRAHGACAQEPESLALAEQAIERQRTSQPDLDALAKDLVAAGEAEYAQQGQEYKNDVEGMLFYCGELGGKRPTEGYAAYLRRILDRLIELEALQHTSPQQGQPREWSCRRREEDCICRDKPCGCDWYEGPPFPFQEEGGST
jgi:hypothetical protein